MRFPLCILFFLCYFSLSAQITYTIGIRDFKSNEPLSYCSVIIKASGKGTITNEEGFFQLSLNPLSDTIIVSYLGYGKRAIAVSTLSKKDFVSLERSGILLREAVIYGNDDDFLYNIFYQSKGNLARSGGFESKVYFSLETVSEKQPVEILECYYNGKIKSNKINELHYKNGRVGLARLNKGYFVSLNISKALVSFDLLKPNEDFPATPFQFDKKNLKKHFDLRLVSIISDADSIYHIEFNPKNKQKDYFAGEVWINKKTMFPVKIEMKNDLTDKHPLLPLWDTYTIDSVSLDLSYSFLQKGHKYLLNHTSFKYSLGYDYKEDFHERLDEYREIMKKRHIETRGIMYVYDYNEPFILPKADYDPNFSDYRLITSFPYNEVFWKMNKGLVQNERQKEYIAFFEKNGLLFSFSKITGLKNTIFENNNLFWSSESRLSVNEHKLDREGILNPSLKSSMEHNEVIRSELYKFKTQLYLDINQDGDAIHHFSASIFDIFESYYLLKKEPEADCFINIYFDLVEIERQKMEKILQSGYRSVAELEAVYELTLTGIDQVTKRYLKEVQSGKNFEAFIRWNNYVMEHLGINNFTLSGITNIKN